MQELCGLDCSCSQAWMAIDYFDTALEKKLDYAFDNDLGYLTACPTNLGTGIRVSAMLHLPGLVLGEQINPIIQSVNKLGLAVRGLYGEGTEALGNVFQVSNQMTLGESETVIVERLEKVLSQIIEHEENARQTLLEKKPKVVFNHIGRAGGNPGQCAQYFFEGDDELAVAVTVGRGHGLVPRRRPRLGGRIVFDHAAGAFAKAAFRQAHGRGARSFAGGHGPRTAQGRKPADCETGQRGELHAVICGDQPVGWSRFNVKCRDGRLRWRLPYDH